MATYYVDDGGGKSVTAATKANPCQVTITGHGFSTNDKVVFHNIGGMTQLNFTNGSTGYTVTVVDSNNITIGVDSTAYGTYTSGGTAHNGLSWGAAFTSVSALDDVFTFASSDIVYIGHDHVCQYAHTANRTITLPTSGLPTIFISATTGSDPPTYQASTTNQIDTSDGAYNLTLDGSASMYGCRINSGTGIALIPDTNESCVLYNCTLSVAASSGVQVGNSSAVKIRLNNCTVDLTNDGTTTRSGDVLTAYGITEINGMSFINAGYRTGAIFAPQSGTTAMITDTDFSGFTNATVCELVSLLNAAGTFTMRNCKTAATFTHTVNTIQSGAKLSFVNVGSTNQPSSLVFKAYEGDIASSSSIYRSGGGAVEGVACSWLVTTTANCSQDAPLYSPDIYGHINSTGSKTFDVYITNDSADFYDNEVWLEIDYLGTASSGLWSNKTDYMADRLATAALQTDDTGSTWNGSGPSYTYKQKLSVTATVNTTGMFRARVCVGVTSIASTRKFYIDPLVTVS
jgi:hypothetical protein